MEEFPPPPYIPGEAAPVAVFAAAAAEISTAVASSPAHTGESEEG